MTILMLAVIQQAQPLIDLILLHARDKQSICKQKNIHGDTALHLAALINSKEAIEKLLDYGFNKEAQNNVSVRIKTVAWRNTASDSRTRESSGSHYSVRRQTTRERYKHLFSICC